MKVSFVPFCCAMTLVSSVPKFAHAIVENTVRDSIDRARVGTVRDFCGSTAADSSSVCIGTSTGARSRDLDLCCLPELPESSSGTVNGSCITIGCIGGTGGVFVALYGRRL